MSLLEKQILSYLVSTGASPALNQKLIDHCAHGLGRFLVSLMHLEKRQIIMIMVICMVFTLNPEHQCISIWFEGSLRYQLLINQIQSCIRCWVTTEDASLTRHVPGVKKTPIVLKATFPSPPPPAIYLLGHVKMT